MVYFTSRRSLSKCAALSECEAASVDNLAIPLPHRYLSLESNGMWDRPFPKILRYSSWRSGCCPRAFAYSSIVCFLQHRLFPGPVSGLMASLTVRPAVLRPRPSLQASINRVSSLVVSPDHLTTIAPRTGSSCTADSLEKQRFTTLPGRSHNPRA